MNDIPEARKELERASEALASAQLLLQGGLHVDALSRAYYAVLHAAKAALLTKGIAADSHDAVKRLFGLHLVKTGDIPSAYGIILRKEQDDRLLADYDVAFEPEKERVELRCAEAKDFIETIYTFLDNRTD